MFLLKNLNVKKWYKIKKLLTFFIVLFWFGFVLFSIVDAKLIRPDLGQDDDSTSNINISKQIEVSDYYGMSVLLINLHLDILQDTVRDTKYIIRIEK